jgi:hypothetical protein
LKWTNTGETRINTLMGKAIDSNAHRLWPDLSFCYCLQAEWEVYQNEVLTPQLLLVTVPKRAHRERRGLGKCQLGKHLWISPKRGLLMR